MDESIDYWKISHNLNYTQFPEFSHYLQSLRICIRISQVSSKKPELMYMNPAIFIFISAPG